MNAAKLRRGGGYTLIELSIVVAVVGILLGSGVTLLAQKSEADKYRLTIARLDTLEGALQVFYNRNGRLPCPAAGDARLESEGSGDTFGAELTYDTVTDSCPDAPSDGRGVVPVRTLNLADELIFDGWGRKFSYQIATGMGDADDFVRQDYPGDLSVKNVEGYELTTVNYLGNYGAAYVLFSHGKNGYRAWLPNVTGSDAGVYIVTDAATTDLLMGVEIENVDGDQSFIKDISSEVFDDTLRFKTKMELQAAKRRVSPLRIASRACQSAGAVIEHQDYLDSYVALEPGGRDYATKAAAILKAAYVIDKLCTSGVAPSNDTCARGLSWLGTADGKLYDDCHCATDGEYYSTILTDREEFGTCM